jgi:hypothetical protein
MKHFFQILILMLTVSFSACKKDNTGGITQPTPGGSALNYGDSIFYLKNQTGDYIVFPNQMQTGRYYGFPEGLDLDGNSGAINISKSETGLRYRISFIPDGSTDSSQTIIVISGINFRDGFYKLTTADSVIKPLYNANLSSAVPGVHNGSAFDIGSGCNTAGCNVDFAAGSINLAQTVRNGVFGAIPTNNDRHEFDLNYEINDQSGKAPNTIRVKLYYFNSIADVTQEVYDIINSREGALLGVQPKPISFAGLTSTNSTSSQTTVLGKAVPKPRPPCIFILGR